MEPFMAIASLSIKAVNTFFEYNNSKQYSQIIKQNKEIIDFLKNESLHQKYDLLKQANAAMEGALLCQNQNMKEKLLDKAYDYYTKLMNLVLCEEMPDGSYFDNSHLICCGYYGRFYVFGIQKEYKNSTSQVYECASRFPEKAIKIFDQSFFPKIDCSELFELCDNLHRINHYKPAIGIYENIPNNMAKALIEMQIEKYRDKFKQILTIINNSNNE